MLMGRELRSGALLAEGSVELTPGSDRALVVAGARFHVEGTFEVRCANQYGRVREGFGVVGPTRASSCGIQIIAEGRSETARASVRRQRSAMSETVTGSFTPP